MKVLLMEKNIMGLRHMRRTSVFSAFLVLSGIFGTAALAQTDASSFPNVTPLPVIVQDNSSLGAAEDGAQTESGLEALALRLTRIEQLLRAQQNIQRSGQNQGLMDITQRLEKIEIALEEQKNALASATPMTQSGTVGNFSDSNAADLRMYLNALAESSRIIQGQTDEILRRIEQAEKDSQARAADAEFRFQAIEGKIRQEANAGSAEPQIIGTIAPVAPIIGEVDVVDESAPLVGEAEVAATPAKTPLADPVALYERGLGALRGGNYEDARRDFRQLVADFPQHKRAGNAQYWLGETYYVERNYKKAAEAFLVGYSQFGQNDKAPDSLLKLGMTLIAMGETKTGCDAFAELGVKFPNANEVIRQRADVERKRAACK